MHCTTAVSLQQFVVTPKRASLTAVHARRGLVPLRAMTMTSARTRRSRRSVVVEANELNKWAGRAFDDQCDPSPFDKETADVLLRVLTGRAVKTLIMQLMECDLLVAQWMNNFAADNPPTDGNRFVARLLDQRGVSITDPTTNTLHTVDPQVLARRVLIIRDEMVRNATLNLPDYVERENTTLLRSHLEKNTFVSGNTSSTTQYKERRGYFRRRGGASVAGSNADEEKKRDSDSEQENTDAED